MTDDPVYTSALMGAGSCLLSIANYWLERQNANDDKDEGNASDEDRELTEGEKAAKEALVEGVIFASVIF